MIPAPPRLRCALVGALLGLAACAGRPDIAARIDPAALAAPAPDLVPLGSLLTAAAALDGTTVAGPPAGRLAALRARANRLRGPVIDTGTRAAMAAAARRAAP